MTRPAGTNPGAASEERRGCSDSGTGCLDGTNWQRTTAHMQLTLAPQTSSPLEKLPVNVLKIHLQKEPGPNEGAYELYFFYQNTEVKMFLYSPSPHLSPYFCIHEGMSYASEVGDRRKPRGFPGAFFLMK